MKTIKLVPLAALAVSAACASNSTPGPVVVHVPHSAMSPAPARSSQPVPPELQTASLWATSPNSLLSMRRAKDIGDLLTVVVEMNDQASLQNSLTRSRSASDDVNLNAFFGLPEWANGVLPGGASLSPGVDMDRSSDLNGSGAVKRAEKIAFTLASRVVGVEPNGNLIIEGYQQTQVSNEVRYLSVSGVIRPQDITRDNTVTYEKIADARLTYVSQGEATGSVERKLLPKLVDTVVPF